MVRKTAIFTNKSKGMRYIMHVDVGVRKVQCISMRQETYNSKKCKLQLAIYLTME